MANVMKFVKGILPNQINAGFCSTYIYASNLVFLRQNVLLTFQLSLINKSPWPPRLYWEKKICYRQIYMFLLTGNITAYFSCLNFSCCTSLAGFCRSSHKLSVSSLVTLSR